MLFLVSPYLGKAMILLVFLLILNITSLATPYYLKLIIDDVFPKKNIHILIIYSIAMIGVYLIRVYITYIYDIYYTKFSQNIIVTIRNNAFNNILKKPLSFFQNRNIGETNFILLNDVNNVQYSLSYLINDVISNIVLIGTILVIMYVMNTSLTLVSLTLIPIIVLVISISTPKIHSTFKRLQFSESKLYDYFSDALKNIKLIKLFNTYHAENLKVNNLQLKVINAHVDNTKIDSINKNSIFFVAATIPIVIILYGGYKVMNNIMTVGSLIAFIQYLNRLIPPIKELTNSYSVLLKSIVSMERINDFIGIDHSTNLQSKKVTQKTIHKIDFVNISFSYTSQIVIEDVNLSFESGYVYFIKGQSGNGKSTLINLLCGLLMPSCGEILFNNYRLENIKDIEKHICIIEKENQIFSDTIFANIDYGIFTSSETVIKEALHKVNMLSIVEHLDNGIYTDLNSNLTILSEGQKQRISLARIFLKNYSVIILDEATSSLDINNEQEILRNVKAENPNAILIIISHRESLNEICDYSIEVNNSKVYVKKINCNSCT